MKVISITLITILLSAGVIHAEVSFTEQSGTRSPQAEFVKLEADGFGPRVVKRDQELSPLEEQIRELEFQLMGGLSAARPDDMIRENLKAQLGELYAQRPSNQRSSSLDQGAGDCPATVIPSTPYTDTGTTVGQGDNHNTLDPGSCPPLTNGPEVVYQFQPTITTTYTISLAGSLYDTYLWVNTGGPCPGNTQVGCNDDANSTTQSELQLELLAGSTYYIFVGGNSLNEGTYTLSIWDDCNIDCQATDLLECDEAPFTLPNFEDCNGGCNNTNPAYQRLHACQAICGLGFTDGNSRDTDWYEFRIFEACSLQFTISSDFPIQVVVVDQSCPPNALETILWSNPCSTLTYVTQCYQPGWYRLFVATTELNAHDPLNYRVRFDPIPCNGCVVDGFLQAPGTILGNTCGAGDDCDIRPSEELIYCVNLPHTGYWRFSLCGSTNSWNSYLHLRLACCDNELLTNNNFCGGLSQIDCSHWGAGTIYLSVEGSAPFDCGDFELEVVECIGACCYGSHLDPTCEILGLEECEAVFGTLYPGEACEDVVCELRPACIDGSLFSQTPNMPGEIEILFTADESNGTRICEEYQAYTDSITSIRFWGVFLSQATDTPCVPDSPQEFNLDFVDSLSGAVQSYNVSVTGTELSYIDYTGGEAPFTVSLWDFFVELVPPCTLGSGYLCLSAGAATPDCDFNWMTTNTPDGSGHFRIFDNPPDTIFSTKVEMSFCLNGPCPGVDSLVIRPITPFDDYVNFGLGWWQPTGTLTIWASSDPNAVFPATFVSLGSGYIPAGSYDTEVSMLDTTDYGRFVLTVECGPPLGNPSTSALESPFNGTGFTPIRREE